MNSFVGDQLVSFFDRSSMTRRGALGGIDVSEEEIRVLASGDSLVEGAFELREKIFSNEQGVPKHLEFDGKDGESVHLVATIEDRVVGTLRIERSGSCMRIGRVAVQREFRGQGVGSRLVLRAIEEIWKKGDWDIILHAQLQTIGFYRRLGFVEEGEIDVDAGIQHIWMRRHLDRGVPGTDME